MIKKYLLILLTLTTLQLTSQKAELARGWDLFNNNNLKESQTYFEKAKIVEETKAEALIGLALVHEQLNNSEQAKDAFREFIRVSKNPFPYVYAMWYKDGMKPNKELNRSSLSFYEELKNNPKANSTIKAMLNERLGNLSSQMAKFKDARDYADNIGSIKQWQTLGAFENISASGFDKDYGVLNHPEENHVFKNKRNVDIQWFDIETIKNSRWIDFTYHHYTSNSIIYAQTFCNSTVEQIAQLRIGTSGSLKVWVNDLLVIRDDQETNNNLDTYIQQIKLKKGTNRILVQIGSSEIDRSNFMCRLTDLKGEVLNNLTFSTDQSDYEKETEYKGTSIRNEYEIYFENQIKENPNKIINHLLLIQSYWLNRKPYLTKKAIKQAEKIAPNSTYLKTLKALVLIDDNNTSGLSKLLEELKENDPNSYLALDLEYNELIKQENYEDAKEMIKSIESAYGRTPSTYVKKITLASNDKDIEYFKELVNKMYKNYPNSYEAVAYKYAVEQQVNKSNSAYKILKKYNKKNYNQSALTDLAAYYFEVGLPYEGIEIYEDLSKNHPIAIGYKNVLAKIKFAMQDYRGAKKYYNECLKIAPYVSDYHIGKAQAYEAMDLDKSAIESYKKAIEISPNSYETREKLRVLEGKEKLFNIFKEIPDPEEVYKNAPTEEDYPEDKSIFLLDEDQIIVYEDGASEEKHYKMVKVLNASGVDNWKEYSIGAYRNQRLNVEEAKVFKKDGSKIDAEVNYNYIVFTDLEIGDAIYIVYKKETYNSGKLANHFWDKRYFNSFMPSISDSYSLLIHKDKKFKHKVINSRLTPTIEDYDDFLLYRWQLKKTPALVSEPFMPPLSDVGNILHISSFENWNEISEWYKDLAETKQKADFEVKEKIQEIFEGKENLTEKEKVEIIYNYIVNDIRYSSISFRQSGLIPQKASSVINTKLGDCKDVSTLFVTMCKEMGLDANLVLVNTRNQGDQDLYFPSIDFNHCIARVQVDNKPYYVELTSDLLPFSTFGSSLLNATALNIVDNTDIEQLQSKNRLSNTINRNTLVTFKGDDMMVSKTNTKSGYFSATMRSRYRDIGKEKQEKEMNEAVQGTYIKIKLENLSFDSTLTENTPELTYKYSYKAEDVFTDVGGLYIVKLPWADNKVVRQFLSSEKRKFPIALWDFADTDLETEKLTITLPSDKKITKVPENVNYTSDFFDYSLTYSLKGNILEVNRSFNFKTDIIAPDKYEAFKNLYEKVIKADARQLAFNDK